MDFNYKKINYLVVESEKGNTIKCQYISDENIILYSKESITEPSETDATPLDIQCSFDVTSQMVDLLSNSKVLYAEGYSPSVRTIRVYPLFGFTWDKLTDILDDLTGKFNL